MSNIDRAGHIRGDYEAANDLDREGLLAPTPQIIRPIETAHGRHADSIIMSDDGAVGHVATEEYFNKIRDLIVGKKIKEIKTATVETTDRDEFGYSVTGDALILEDGTILNLYMSESDCCAGAYGKWNINTLEAGITDIRFNVRADSVESYPDDSYDGSRHSLATITVLHNQNPLATAECYADDGNSGYYFSVLNLEVKLPTGKVIDESILSA